MNFKYIFICFFLYVFCSCSKTTEFSDAIIAAKNGSLQSQSILNRYSDWVNKEDSSGWNLLMHATDAGHLSTVEYLVGLGANPLQKRMEAPKIDALYLATKNNAREILGLFLEQKNADNFLYGDGDNLLSIAARHDAEDCAHFLLERGMSPNIYIKASWEYQGHSPLMIAARHHSLKTAKILLQKGANVQLTGEHGTNALLEASASVFDEVEMIELLLEYGAKLEQIDEMGNTALLVACLGKYPQKVAFLLIEGANPNVYNQNGFMPLAYASVFKELFTLFDIFMEMGAKVNFKNQREETIIDFVEKTHFGEQDKMLKRLELELRSE